MAKTQASSQKSAKSPKPQKTQAPRNSQKSQNPHRGAKVAAVFIVILVLLLGGLATWFFAFYNNPEKVTLDAVNRLFTADNVGFEGGFSLWLSDEQKKDSPITGALLSFDSPANHLPMSNTATLQVLFNPEQVQGEPKVVIKLKNLIMRDGVLYFQISGLMDSLNTFNYSLEEWSEIESYLPLIESIDNEWWQIDLDDVLANLELPAQQEDGLSELYSCVVTAMNRDTSSEMAKVYDAHRFIQVTPSQTLAPQDGNYDVAVESWHNAYEVTIDKNALAGYINAIPETAAANEFYACFNAVEDEYADVPLSIGAGDFDEISADDIQLPEDLRIFIEVSTFGHQLNRIYVYQGTSDYYFDGGITVKYQNVSVSAPDEFRPISDLIEEIIELLQQNVPSHEEI